MTLQTLSTSKQVPENKIMSASVSVEEFNTVQQQLMDFKLKYYESTDREKKLNNGKRVL
jgi:N-acetyl-beta-hexosaminidase